VSSDPPATDDEREEAVGTAEAETRVHRPAGLFRTAAAGVARVYDWIERPQPVLRLVILRIGVPLWVIGFMSDRLAHADDWISSAAFRVPTSGGGWTTPVYIPGVSPDVAWTIALLLVVSGLLTSIGWKTRTSALVFAATLTFVALADQLSAFTVTRIGPVLVLAIALGPAGSRISVDAWTKRRSGGKRAKAVRPLGGVSFVQLFLPVFYCASGVAKARGDWLSNPLVLWTHLHDSYQTAVTVVLGNVMPTWLLTVQQALVLAFEIGAPLWFALRRTRPFGLLFGLGMHVMIGLMFGPVVWFALLMMTLLVAAYVPERAMAPLERLAERLERAPVSPRGARGR
jgi:hypothetical protein